MKLLLFASLVVLYNKVLKLVLILSILFVACNDEGYDEDKDNQPFAPARDWKIQATGAGVYSIDSAPPARFLSMIEFKGGITTKVYDSGGVVVARWEGDQLVFVKDSLRALQLMHRSFRSMVNPKP